MIKYDVVQIGDKYSIRRTKTSGIIWKTPDIRYRGIKSDYWWEQVDHVIQFALIDNRADACALVKQLEGGLNPIPVTCEDC